MNPIPFLFIIVGTLTFTALIYGNELAAQSYPEMRDVNFSECDGGALETMACLFKNVFLTIGNAFAFIFGSIAFLWNLVSFNIPGAPTFIRFFLGSTLGFGLVWSIVVLTRG